MIGIPKTISRRSDVPNMAAAGQCRLVGYLLLVAATVVAAHPDISYYEPELPLEYADAIHTYAYAHRMPEVFAESNSVATFLEIADHYDSESAAAKKLTLLPEYVDSLDGENALPENYPAEIPEESLVELEARERALTAKMELLNTAAKKKKGGKKPKKGKGGYDHKPETIKPMPVEPNPNPFHPGDNYDAGVFKNHYRRAVYGLRRRRMPLTLNALSYTINPFRRPMNSRTGPADVLFPRQRMLQALNPKLTDIGSQGQPGALPYGGHSSFAALRHQEPRPGTIGGLGVSQFPAPVPAFGQQGPESFSDGRQMPGAHPLPVSPYVPGMAKFFDFYGGGGDKAGGAAGGEEAPSP